MRAHRVDIHVIEDTEPVASAPLQSYLPFAGSSGCSVAGKCTDASSQQTTRRSPCKKYKCFGCKKIFARKINFHKHMRSQSCGHASSVDEGELQPNDISLQQPLDLQEPFVKSSARNSFKCSECNYLTNKRFHFDRHIRIHTGQKPFKCPQCDYACGRKDNLVVHFSTHTGYKPFKCPHCDRAFMQRTKLIQHIAIHTGEKPLKCPRCDYACRDKRSLIAHIRKHIG